MQPDPTSTNRSLIHCADHIQHKNPKNDHQDERITKREGRRSGALEICPRQWSQVEKDGRA